MNHAKLLTLLITITTATSFCSQKTMTNSTSARLGAIVETTTLETANPLADLARLAQGQEIILKRSNGTHTYALVYALSPDKITLRVSTNMTKTYALNCPKYPLEALFPDVKIPLSGLDLYMEEIA